MLNFLRLEFFKMKVLVFPSPCVGVIKINIFFKKKKDNNQLS